MEIAAESARRTVGDVVEAQHPTFAAIVTAAIVIGGALILIGLVASVVSKGYGAAEKVLMAGAALVLVSAVATMAFAIATVFPAIGLGICAVAVVGLGFGLLLRRKASG